MKKTNFIARIIVEVLGAPKEHVEETLHDVVEKLKQEDGIKVTKDMSYEAEQQQNGLWSAFAEIEYEASTLKRMLEICFDYMPSTFEVLEPAGLEIDTNVIADLFNDLLAKLHRYAMAIKNLQAENILLKESLKKERRESGEKNPSKHS